MSNFASKVFWKLVSYYYFVSDAVTDFAEKIIKTKLFAFIALLFIMISCLYIFGKLLT